MKLSLIILNYNVQHFLEQAIISAQRAVRNIDSEIIVVDNNSEDGSCEMVRAKFPNIQLIANDDNLGFSKANNQAAAKARGKILCILNPDTAVAEDTFWACLKQVEVLKDLGVLGVNLIDGTGNHLPESKRNVPTPNRAFYKLFGLSSKNDYYVRTLDVSGIGEVPVLPGAFMFIKKSVFDQVGGFDEDYFMYGEDIDLSYKISMAGYKNYYLGSTRILHYKGESTFKDSSYRDRFYGAMQIFYKKHFRSNFFRDTAVKLGIVLAKTFRSSRQPGRSIDLALIGEAIVLTDDLHLIQKLAEVIKIPIKSTSKTIFNEAAQENTMFIFDADYMPYNQIFMIMDQLKNRNNQFRIKPPGASFILGSDRSDEKGSVVHF